MIVIPLQPGALIVRVVVISLSCGYRRARNVVKHAPGTVQETYPVRSARRKPTERTAIANPGYEPAVKMGGNAVVCLICARDRPVNREDMPGRKRIGEPNTISRSAICDDDATQMARYGIRPVLVTPQ